MSVRIILGVVCVSLYVGLLWIVSANEGSWDGQFKARDVTFSQTQQPFPNGYSTDLIESLHDLPRYTSGLKATSSAFKPGQKDYWQGAAYMSSVLVFVTLLIVICCGIPACILGKTKCCGLIRPQPKPASLTIAFRAIIVTMIAVTVGAVIGALISNNQANNEFIPIVQVPEQLLGGVNGRLTTIQREAAAVNISVPNEVVRLQRTVQAAQDALAGVLPESVKNGLDRLYDVRGYAFILLFCFAITTALGGVFLAFTAKGDKWVFWIAMVMVSFFTMMLIGAPLLMVDQVVADVCIDSNVVITNPIRNATAYPTVIYYLFCPENYSAPVGGLEKLINDTNQVLYELEEGKAEADAESDGQLSDAYEVRIQQTQNLLAIEANLTSCEQTNGEYLAIQEEICKGSLKWNWTLTVFIIVIMVFQFVLTCLAFCAAFILSDEEGDYDVLE